MRQAQDLLQCERCTVYILNKNIPPEEEEVKKSFLSNTILAKKKKNFLISLTIFSFFLCWCFDFMKAAMFFVKVFQIRQRCWNKNQGVFCDLSFL